MQELSDCIILVYRNFNLSDDDGKYYQLRLRTFVGIGPEYITSDRALVLTEFVPRQ